MPICEHPVSSLVYYARWNMGSWPDIDIMPARIKCKGCGISADEGTDKFYDLLQKLKFEQTALEFE